LNFLSQQWFISVELCDVILEGCVIDFHSCYFISFDALEAQRSVDQIPGGGEIFCDRLDALGPTQPLAQRVPEFFPGVKQPEYVVDHPSQSSAEVKERVALYPHSSSGPSWVVLV
jgi:hypothetical protein